jgi:hypothetical protein
MRLMKEYKLPITQLVINRILSRRNITNMGYTTPCWLYGGSINPNGYGQIRIGSSRIYSELRLVHVISAILWLPDYNPRLWTLHKCDIRSCFNPEHLFQGDNRLNMIDMWNKGRRKKQFP